MATLCVPVPFHLVSGCRVFQPTKNAFVDTLRSVVSDVKWFLLFLILTMWGFAGAFYILFREDQQQYEVSLTFLGLYTQEFKFPCCATCALLCMPTVFCMLRFARCALHAELSQLSLHGTTCMPCLEP